MKVAVLLFDDFETLDVFGPVEILGRLKEHYQVYFYSQSGGLVKNDHGVAIDTLPLSELSNGADIFLIPGGYGTRIEVNNAVLIQSIKEISIASKYVFTVCTLSPWVTTQSKALLLEVAFLLSSRPVLASSAVPVQTVKTYLLAIEISLID